TLRIVPSAQAGPSVATIKDTTNSLGTHDTLRYGPRSLASEINTVNPLQHRLENWEETQDMMKLTLQRNLYGLHAPIRQLMERKIVATGSMLPGLSNSNIHMDILMGRDETLDVTDLFGGASSEYPYFSIC
ncbi:proteasome maturation factor UMP1, partial [Sistotremastrum niveocremeum HHB9708]